MCACVMTVSHAAFSFKSVLRCSQKHFYFRFFSTHLRARFFRATFFTQKGDRQSQALKITTEHHFTSSKFVVSLIRAHESSVNKSTLKATHWHLVCPNNPTLLVSLIGCSSKLHYIRKLPCNWYLIWKDLLILRQTVCSNSKSANLR